MRSPLTREEEYTLSKICQSNLRKLRQRLGSEIDENASPEDVLIAAKTKRPVPPEVAKIEDARDQLVESCTPWAMYIACKWINEKHSSLETDDLKQAAMYGLMLAALRYQAKKAKWSTYCTWWIRQSIGRTVRYSSVLIRIPEYRLLRFNRGELDDAETARLKTLVNIRRWPVAENIPLTSEKLKPDFTPIYEELTRILTTRELFIVILRYGLSDFPILTLREISKYLGLSRERVRQLQLSAVKKLRSSDLLRNEFDSIC